MWAFQQKHFKNSCTNQQLGIACYMLSTCMKINLQQKNLWAFGFFFFMHLCDMYGAMDRQQGRKLFEPMHNLNKILSS